MENRHWTIDDRLRLIPCPSKDTNWESLVAPEQTIDTLLQRNLDVVPRALFGAPGRFVFHSSHYWGAFDVCCVLADGRLVAFENKGKRPTKADFQKFCRDVRKISTEGFGYVEMRFKHALSLFPTYQTYAERMFAAFFLGIRSDTQKDVRSLADEACTKLSITRDQFQERFRDGNGWLNALATSPNFRTYLSEFTGADIWKEFIPVLLVPSASLERVQQWASEIEEPTGTVAHLVTFGLGIKGDPYPSRFSVRIEGTFVV